MISPASAAASVTVAPQPSTPHMLVDGPCTRTGHPVAPVDATWCAVVFGNDFRAIKGYPMSLRSAASVAGGTAPVDFWALPLQQKPNPVATRHEIPEPYPPPLCRLPREHKPSFVARSHCRTYHLHVLSTACTARSFSSTHVPSALDVSTPSTL